ncbi:uncharacterized protein F5Z01DRAFT_384352 [Emericellopsis atlantica]|uniref:Uncharacterized protein n=1 Tax=Emericellopsis atlantica TaxID=2614577 RepID=A0A9P7ZT78_9HYPO|nr:uncharacterized protein F5Z01DRAFT_384352 [Emericellopsis atlantica]KAG9257377.1 hypothetical protein F5Z01DRAFT_384352 [Emericellopsis atlantica]
MSTTKAVVVTIKSRKQSQSSTQTIHHQQILLNMATKHDIFMSIKPAHMENIASGLKNHEYRKYKLPDEVRRIWFYTTAPTSAVCYIAEVSCAKEPGEVPENGGIGNADFNADRYEIADQRKIETKPSSAIHEGTQKTRPS